jgi:hypothetical protein
LIFKNIEKLSLVGWLMVFDTTFNNSSVISWRSVLFVGKTTGLAQVTDGATVLVKGTYFTGSCKPRYGDVF